MDGVLYLTDDEWFDNYSSHKYRFILLVLNYTDISVENLFLLASSRLYNYGEFTLCLNTDSCYHDIKELAKLFNFTTVYSSENSDALKNRSQVRQYIFRFDGAQTKSSYEIVLADRFDEDCRNLYEDVFDKPISKKFWRWKYPKDQRNWSVIARNDCKVIAHYGGCNRKGVYNNKDWSLGQACDVMVAPADRGGIFSSVLFELTALGEKHLNREKNDICLAFGFPHGRHYKLGVRLKLFSLVSPIFLITFEVPKQTISCESTSPIEEVFDKKDVISAITTMYLKKNTLILKRDYTYLLKRYIFHPEFKYKIYKFADSFFIIKVMKRKLFLMDYWGHLESYPDKLNLFINSLSIAYSGYTLELWCLENISQSFMNSKEVKNTGAFLVCRKYSNQMPEFKDWWITMGDTDFL